MPTSFSTAITKNADGFKAGYEAGQRAIQRIKGGSISISIVFSSASYNHKDVIKGVKKATGGAPLIGCSTTEVFTEERVEQDSVAVGLISTDAHCFYFGLAKGLKEDLLRCLSDAKKQIAIPKKNLELFPHRAIFILADPYSGTGSELVKSALNIFKAKIFGGMAGASSLGGKTHVFVDEQAASNAVALCEIRSKAPIHFGVKHGHIPISPLLEVTKTHGNTVYELDGKKAWDVWKEYTRKYAKEDLGIDVDLIQSDEQYMRALAAYEIGLRTGARYIVRALFSFNKDGSIDLVAPTYEGNVVSIMRGTKDSLIGSAKEAAIEATKHIKKDDIAGALIFDCSIRSAVLQKAFSLAVDGIKEVLCGIPVLGFETLGEIAMNLKDIEGFHNTTTVITLIPK